MKVENEDAGKYESDTVAVSEEEQVIQAAMRILESRVAKEKLFDSPELVARHISLRLANATTEHFGILILNQHHYLVKEKILFVGTNNQCNVFVRDIIAETLKVNGAAIVCFHNHPSGQVKPSKSDEKITEEIVSACNLMGIRMLDHVIVGGGSSFSFAKENLLKSR